MFYIFHYTLAYTQQRAVDILALYLPTFLSDMPVYRTRGVPSSRGPVLCAIIMSYPVQL